jgi:predicted ATPase
MKTSEQLRRAIADTALEVLGDDPEIRLQVAALAGSLDDTLSDEFILAE